MLISDWYRDEQHWLHTEHFNFAKYGTGGPQWVEVLRYIASAYGCRSMIDYGCGKALLARNDLLPEYEIQCYDPALNEFADLPKPADLVACMDVLEHIEPDYLDNVIDHIVGLAKKLIFVSVSLKLAARTLRDGRNSHLIVADSNFWIEQFVKRGCAMEKEYERRPSIQEWVALIRPAP